MTYLISHAPHIRERMSVPAMMCLVIGALLPATMAGVYFFGLRALSLILVCVFTAVVTEYLVCRMMRREPTLGDGSAMVTGLLLALCISPSTPYFAAVLGAIFAIAIGKQLFGRFSSAHDELGRSLRVPQPGSCILSHSAGAHEIPAPVDAVLETSHGECIRLHRRDIRSAHLSAGIVLNLARNNQLAYPGKLSGNGGGSGRSILDG
jgi:hypothetical protein